MFISCAVNLLLISYMVSMGPAILISQTTNDWPVWGGEPTHQSVQLLKGAMFNAPGIKWAFNTDGAVEMQFSAVADADGDGAPEVLMVTMTPGGTIYCLDGATGTEEWSFTGMGSIESSPAVADVDGDGTPEVFFGSYTNVNGLHCLDGATGTEKWCFSTGAEGVHSSPAIADVDGGGDLEVIFSTGWGKLYCLDAITSTEKWLFSVGSSLSSSRSSPGIADVDGDGTMEVIMGSLNNNIYCVSGEDGTEEWHFTTNGDVRTSASLGDVDNDGDMEVVFGSYDSTVYCLDGATGTEEWSFKANYKINSSPAIADVDGDGVMEVFIGANKVVYCLDGATGTEEWASPDLESEIHSAVSLADINMDGRLEVLASNNLDKVYCINSENGAIVWSFNTLVGDPHCPVPADVDGDNCTEIVVGLGGQKIYALDDGGNAQDCGALYSGADEGSPDHGSLDFRSTNQGLYLFVPGPTQVSLSLYNASGQLMQEIYNGLLPAGAHSFVPKIRTRGVYFALLRYPGGKQSLVIAR